MSFEWARFLDVADGLRRSVDAEDMDSGLREAAFRTAISRAYYAAFHQARARYGRYWADALPDHRRRTSHMDVIWAYNAKKPYIGDPDAKVAVTEVVKRLGRLKTLREHADYEPEMYQAGRKASEAVADARQIQDALKRLTR